MLLTPDARLGWRADAACADVDPEVMTRDPATPDDVHEAKAVCAGCDVRPQCGAFARSMDEPYGAWGGEWFGPVEVPRVADVLSDDKLRELVLVDGLSSREIAERYGLTPRQIVRARARAGIKTGAGNWGRVSA